MSRIDDPGRRARAHRERIWRAVACSAAVFTVSGCASFINDPAHPIKVETLDRSQQAIEGAECALTNNLATVNMRSGDTAHVLRSTGDLAVVCKLSGQPDASARVVSRLNGGMAGNILVGGIVGATVDHSNGRAYSYPTWLQLEFGKSLLIDRASEQEGKPTRGTDVPARP